MGMMGLEVNSKGWAIDISLLEPPGVVVCLFLWDSTLGMGSLRRWSSR